MHNTLGVVLAGGQSRRMRVADKFLMPYQQQPLLQHVVDAAQPQVAELVISANGDPKRLAPFGLTVIEDLAPGHRGPLAGIISVMSWSQKACLPYSWLATFAADTPHFPQDCVQKLHQHVVQQNLKVAFAACGERHHYAFALWSFDLLSRLEDHLTTGQLGLHQAILNCRASAVPFLGDPRWFFNLNAPDDWQQLAAMDERVIAQ